MEGRQLIFGTDESGLLSHRADQGPCLGLGALFRDAANINVLKAAQLLRPHPLPTILEYACSAVSEILPPELLTLPALDPASCFVVDTRSHGQVAWNASDDTSSFSPQAPSENLLTSDTPSQKQPTTSNDDHSQDVVPLRDGNPLAAASLCDTNPSECPSINSDDNPCVDEAINVNHAELLIHVILDKDMFKLVDGIDAFPFSLPFALKTALESPYVLHQLLAFSARHMAFLHPQRSAFYLHQAVTLQTRAVSLFNATWTAVDQSNCVAVLAFSSFLGHHLLADTLAKRDPEDGLDAFISQYVRFLEMHRGIFAVATAAWPLLMATELEPILTRSSSFTSRPPRGSHCQRVLELVDGANGLEEEDREACRQSIRYLQVGFDAALAEEGEEEQGFRYQMIISWSMLAPPGVTALLAVKRPEALVIMGYYALLLHHGRNMWQIGDAGAYIFGIIVDYLGPEWDHWLEYPRQTIAADLE